MSGICEVCKKTFSSKKNIKRHLREVHDFPHDSINRTQLNFHCLEQNNRTRCNCTFSTNKLLVEHLTIVHGKIFDTELLSMQTWQDFVQWKAEIEEANKSFYVFKSRTNNATSETFYYHCNRSKTSYTLKCDEERSRRLKSQGSCKLEYSCTSQIKVQKENGSVLVTWQKNHYGHANDLQHLRIPKSERFNIASKLISGVTIRRILETNRDNITSDIKRVDLLTLRDIKNIKTSYGIEVKNGKRKRDPNDAFSNELWVREVQSQETNLNSLQEGSQESSTSSGFPIEDKIETELIPKHSQEHLSYEFNEPSNAKKNRIHRIKTLLINLERCNYEELDDSILNQIHHHLLISHNIIKRSKDK